MPDQKSLMHHAARIAVAMKHGKHAEADTARQDLTAAKVERAIRAGLADQPPMRPEDRHRLAALLSGGAK